MQLFIFLAPLPQHVSAPCSHLQVVFFFSIQFFSTEAAAFVMPILFPDYYEYTWYPCASHMVFDELCCFYAAAMLLVNTRYVEDYMTYRKLSIMRAYNPISFVFSS
jgi:hypothetical protein